MIIGLLKEEKVPVDQRVPLSPLQCKRIKLSYPNIDVLVQSSHNRCFSDDDYRNEGIEIVDDISVCDYLLGVKEVPVDYLIPNKTYLFFSHTIKKQPYNRNLLVKMIEMNINMIDYEVLKDKQGERLLGFGRYAGIIGAYNAFLTYGLKTGSYVLKSAYKCHNRLEMESQLRNLRLNNERIVITGNGRVGKGILEIMKISGIKKVSIHEFLNDIFSEPIFVHLDTMDYNERIDGANSEKYDFYKNPSLYRSSFLRFAEKADIFIAGHYYASGAPYLFTRDDAKLDDFKLKVVADISCDIDGPVASTIRPSMITDPIYGYNKYLEQEVCYKDNDAIAVMAVSNLPCELPKDASESFGNDLLDKVIPLLINENINETISKATICKNGDLTPFFEYLRDYVS